MKTKAAVFLAMVCAVLCSAGCVAIPPLINVEHKNAPGETDSRLRSIEKRLENIENKLEKK